MENQKVKISERHKKFVNDRDDWDDKQIQLSQLYYQTLIETATERTRSNTAKLINIIVFFFILSIIIAFVGGILGR